MFDTSELDSVLQRCTSSQDERMLEKGASSGGMTTDTIADHSEWHEVGAKAEEQSNPHALINLSTTSYVEECELLDPNDTNMRA